MKHFTAEIAWVINALFNNKTGMKIVDENGKEIEGAILEINQTYLLDKIKKRVSKDMLEEFLFNSIDKEDEEG